jgi:hypothetical protein
MIELSKLAAKETLVISGAGISFESGLPTGNSLMTGLLKEASRSTGIADHFSSHSRLLEQWTCAKLTDEFGEHLWLPRLEAVISVLAQNELFGEHILQQLISSFSFAKPNFLHRLCAWHVSQGGKHWTLNFDFLIEQAAVKSNDAQRVLHLHGDLDSSPSQLGATLAVLQNGFGLSTTNRMLNELAEARRVVFVGYSGSDFFDVDPFFRQAFLERQSALEIFWIDHQSEEHQSFSYGESADVVFRKRILEYASINPNIRSTVFAGPTLPLFKSVAVAGTLSPTVGPPIESPQDDTVTPWTITLSKTPSRHPIALVAHNLGLFALSDELMQHEDAVFDGALALRQAFATGRYRTAHYLARDWVAQYIQVAVRVHLFSDS